MTVHTEGRLAPEVRESGPIIEGEFERLGERGAERKDEHGR